MKKLGGRVIQEKNYWLKKEHEQKYLERGSERDWLNSIKVFIFLIKKYKLKKNFRYLKK